MIPSIDRIQVNSGGTSEPVELMMLAVKAEINSEIPGMSTKGLKVKVDLNICMTPSVVIIFPLTYHRLDP